MMNKAKIPTIVGILILMIGVAAGVFLVQSRQIFRLKASPEITPKDIRKTNITDSSFTISWTTDKKIEGFLVWGESPSNLDKTAIMTPNEPKNIHSITLHGLNPETSYYFKINSDGVDFDNEGIPWEVNTGPKLSVPPKSVVISGTVLTSSGTPAANILIYASVGGSSLLSTTTSENGSWVLPISSARTQKLDSYINIDESSTLVEISVQGGPLGIASAQIYSQSAKPAPDISLGEVYDFTNLPPSKGADIPESSIELPKTSTKSSKFKFSGEEIVEEEVVTLETVGDEGVITTNKPEFFGEGPPGTEITVTIESDPQTDSLEVGSDGFWRWSPPESLEEGIHNITITWRDANGVLQKITRSFIVSAEEGPAFTATPSATPTPTSTPSPTPTTKPGVSPTSTPSPTPTRKPTPTPTKVATISGLPEAGTSLPTILLSMLGVGLIVSGALFFHLKKE